MRFAAMVSMILKIFNVKPVLHKSRRQKQTFAKKIKYNVEGYETEFCWTNDEIQLLLDSKKQSFGGVLKDKANFTGKYLRWSLFGEFFEKQTPAQTFSCKTCKNFKKTFF